MKDNIWIKLLFEKADDFLQLALTFVVIVLKPFGDVVGVINFDLEDVSTIANPQCVNDAEFVAYAVNKCIFTLILSIVQGFAIVVKGCEVSGPLAL